MLSEVVLNTNGHVELPNFLELINAMKTGHVGQSRLAKAVQLESDEDLEYMRISVERSGGGV